MDPSRWSVQRSWRAVPAVAALVAAVALAGCAGTAPLPNDATDLRTASDLTNADRSANARLELAAAYFARGQLPTALDEVKLALAARPDLPQGLNLRGLIYAAMGETRLAEESFRRARAVAPRDADTMHNFGWFLCQQGQYAQAEVEFARALAEPQYRGGSRTLLASGVCHARAGNWEAAEAALSKSYELEPGNPAIAYNLADVLYRRGEYQRARFYMRRVNSQAEQVNAQSLWLAARIEKRLGNLAGARDFGNQLRNRFPNSPEALMYERGRYDD
jgi:type IV pilus assembly protein PilF